MYGQFERPYRPRDIADERKKASDLKNNTDKLTFDGANNNARAKAYKKTRELNSDKEIKALSELTAEDELLAELEDLEQEWIES